MGQKFGKYTGGASFSELPETKKASQQPTVTQQWQAEAKEKDYQKAKKTTGVSRTAYNTIQNRKSSSTAKTAAKTSSKSVSKSSNSSSKRTVQGNSMTPAPKPKVQPAHFDVQTGGIKLSNGTTIGGRDTSVSGLDRFRNQGAKTIEQSYQRMKNTTGISRAAYEALQNRNKEKEAASRPSFGERVGTNTLGFASSAAKVLYSIPGEIAKVPASLQEAMIKYGPKEYRKAYADTKKAIDDNVHNKYLNAVLHAATATSAKRQEDEWTPLNSGSKLFEYANDTIKKNLQKQQDVNYRADITGSKFNQAMQNKIGIGLNQAAGSTINSAGFMAGLAVSGGALSELMNAGAAGVQATSKAGNVITRVIENTAKDPHAIATAAATLPDYLDDARESLKEKRAKQGKEYTVTDDTLAVMTAYLQAAVNAGVEVGGGVGSGVEAMTSTQLKNIIKGALQEGNEEIVQGIVDRYTKNVLSGNTSVNDMFSLKNDNAVVNPLAILREGGLGAVGGMVFSGGRLLGNAAANTAAETKAVHDVGKEINKAGMTQAVIDAAKATGENRKARLMAERLDGKNKVSNMQAGRLYQNTVQAAAADAALMNNVHNKTGAYFELRSGMPSRENGSVDLKTKQVNINENGKTSIGDTAKHETTHIAERYAAKQYSDYQNYIISAATENNAAAVESRRVELAKLYPAEQVDSELAAELSAPLMNNRAAINRLAKTKPNFSDKIADVVANAAAHVKNLGGTYVTDNGVELTYSQLHKAEMLWSEAVRNAGGESETNGIKYSIQTDENGNKYVLVDQNQDIFEGVDERNYYKVAQKFMMDTFRNKTMPLSEYNLVKVDKTGIRKYGFSGTAYDHDTSVAKSKAGVELHNLLEASEYISSGVDKKNHKFAGEGFDYYKTKFVVNGKEYEGIIDVGVSSKGAKFYGMTNIKEVPYYRQPSALWSDVRTAVLRKGTSDNRIPQSSEIVKGNNENNFNIRKSLNNTTDIDSIIDTYYDNDTNSGGLTEAAVPREELAEQVGNLKSELTDATLGKGNYEDSWNTALDIVKKIVNNSYVNHDEFAAEYQAAKKYIRRHRMYVQPEAKSGELGESFARFRKNNFGGLLLTSNPSDSKILDVYTDMQNDFPQFFPNADSDMKRLVNMAEFMKESPTAIKGERLYSENDIDGIASSLFAEIGNMVASENPQINTETMANEVVKDVVNSDLPEIVKTKFSKLFTNSMHKSHYDSGFQAEADSRKGAFEYEVHNNKADYEFSQSRLDVAGVEKVWNDLYRTQRWGAEQTTDALALIEHFNQQGDYKSAVDVYELARQHTTEAAQMVQAWSIIDHLTPEGQYILLQRDNNANIRKQVEKLGDKDRKKFEAEAAEAIKKDRQEAAEKRRKKARKTTEESTKETTTDATTERRVFGQEEAKQEHAKTEEKRVFGQEGESEEWTPDPSKWKSNPKENPMIDGVPNEIEYPYIHETLDKIQRQIEEQNAQAEADKYMPDEQKRLRQPSEDKISADTREKLNHFINSGNFIRAWQMLDKINTGYISESDRTFLQDFVERFRENLSKNYDELSESIDWDKFEQENGSLNPDDWLENDYFHELEDGEDGEKITDEERELREYEEYRKKTHLDDVLDAYNIKHISGGEMLEMSRTLSDIAALDTKEAVIDKIMQQSKERHTVTTKKMRKVLEHQDIEMTKQIAIQQVFNKVTDKTSAGAARVAGTVQTMSHLLNLRTMGRNVFSNAAFNTVETLSMDIASAIDAAIGGVYGLATKRPARRSVALQRGSFEKGTWKARKNSAERAYIDIGLDVDTGAANGSRYDGFETSRRTFKGTNVASKVLGTGERLMSYGLTVTDQFTKGGIEYNMEQSLKRQRERSIEAAKKKYTAEEIEYLKNEGMWYTDEEIKQIAKDEAKYRTFQDDSRIAQVLGGLKAVGNIVGFGETRQMGPFKTHTFGAGDIIQKYTRVPGNLISRAIEFSPAGYLKAMYLIGDTAVKQRKGYSFTPKMQRDISMTFGRAMTGTGIMALFYLMSKLGIFTGGRDDEGKNQQNLENTEGISSTQLNLSALGRYIGSGLKSGADRRNGDTLVNIGFLEPINTLMALGYGLAVSDPEGQFNLRNVAEVTGKKLFDQILDIPTMSTAKNVFNTISYGGTGTDVATTIAVSGLTGFEWSVMRQAASFMDTSARNAYNQGSAFKNGVAQFMVNIPKVREKVPERITPFGETRTNTTGNRLLDFINSFASPGNISVYQTTDVSNELYRLAEYDDEVIPAKADGKFKVKGEDYKLYGKDYETFARMSGRTVYDEIKKALYSDYYNQLGDDERAEVLKSIVSKSKTLANKWWAVADGVELTDDDFDTLSIDGTKYRVSPSTQAKYEALSKMRTAEYEKSLKDGSMSVNVAVGKNSGGSAWTAIWTYNDMSEALRKKYLADYDHDIAHSRTSATRAKHIDEKNRFIAGTLEKKLAVGDVFADLPEAIQKQVLNRAETQAKKAVIAEMTDEIVSGVAPLSNSIAAVPKQEEKKQEEKKTESKSGNTGGRVFGQPENDSDTRSPRERLAELFGLSKSDTAKKFTFGQMEPIGKPTEPTEQAKAAAGSASTASTGSGSSSSKKSSKRVYKSSSRKSSGSSSSSGKRASSSGGSRSSSSGRSSSGGGGVLSYVSPTVAEAAELTYNKATPTTTAEESDWSKKTSAAAVAALQVINDRKKRQDELYGAERAQKIRNRVSKWKMSVLTSGRSVAEVLPDFKSIFVNGVEIDLSKLRYSDLDADAQAALEAAFEAKAAEDIPGDTTEA